jgi:hypothetical protein
MLFWRPTTSRQDNSIQEQMTLVDERESSLINKSTSSFEGDCSAGANCKHPMPEIDGFADSHRGFGHLLWRKD